MKSILLLDKSTGCCDCPMNNDDKSCWVTETTFNSADDFDYCLEKLPDCPLKDLPQKQVANEYSFQTYTNGIGVGWNSCLAQITGEEYIPPEYKE